MHFILDSITHLLFTIHCAVADVLWAASAKMKIPTRRYPHPIHIRSPWHPIRNPPNLVHFYSHPPVYSGYPRVYARAVHIIHLKTSIRRTAHWRRNDGINFYKRLDSRVVQLTKIANVYMLLTTKKITEVFLVPLQNICVFVCLFLF